MQVEVQNPFFSLAFQSALNVGAVLFAVFGFLYSVYAMYSDKDIRPPIVWTLRFLCQVIAGLILFNFLLSAYSLWLMLPFGTPVNWPNTVLASGLMVLGACTSAISLWMAFCKME